MNRVVAMTHALAPVLELSPAQDRACKDILTAVERCGGTVVFRVDSGFGRTTVLRNLRDTLPTGAAALVETGKLMKSLMLRQAMPIEESFLDLCLSQLAQTQSILLVDDLHLLMRVAEGFSYPRANMLDIALSTLIESAAAKGIGVVFGIEQDIPVPLRTRAHRVDLRTFSAEDYRTICGHYLPAAQLDEQRVHRFASNLNGPQLRNTCLWMQKERTVNTDAFIEHLESQNLASNVEIKDVEPVSWNDLKGMDDLLLELEAKIALPLENDAMASAMRLRPKRGVLLAGPPGTGKTTIGKALAHRLKSKFFLLDGTVTADASDFFEKAEALFEAAKNNAPSILFIDDADVIFDERSNRGFYRYLLTLLDGLEGAQSGRVCVMMTAMNPSALPPALLRSGRVELWLETRLPNEGARRDIAAALLSGLPEPIASGVDPLRVAQASRGFTGADLKSVVEDGKLLYAYDESCGAVRRQVEEYFLCAIAKIRSKRRGLHRMSRQQGDEGRFGFAG